MKTLWLVPLLLVGCSSATTLRLELEGPPLRSLALDITVGESQGHKRASFAPATGLTLPQAVTVILPDVGAPVTVRADAVADVGTPLTQTVTVTTTPHRELTVLMQLFPVEPDLAPTGDDGGSDGGGDLAPVGNAADAAADAAPDAALAPALTILACAVCGFGQNDAVGPEARFWYINGAALVGNTLYVTDWFNATVRKVDVTSGAVATLPLNDGVNPIGIGGATGLASDGTSLYVVGAWDDTIRKVDPISGRVSLLAGVPGSAGHDDTGASPATFNNPWGAALDGAGNLWVSDFGNASLRKVALSTGAVSTPALSGDKLTAPHALAFYQGDLYVGDGGTLRKVGVAHDPGVVSTPTLPPSTSFGLIDGLAFDAAGTLWLTDASYNDLYEIGLGATPTVTRVAGQHDYSGFDQDGFGLAAGFYAPRPIVLDGQGAAYVGEGPAVRKVTLDAIRVDTLAGRAPAAGSTDAPPRFNQPSGLLFDGNDTIYVGDYGNAKIRKLSLSTGVTSTFAASVGSVTGMAFDGAGNLYAADFDDHVIRQISPTGAGVVIAGQVGTHGTTSGAGSSALFYNPVGLAFDGAHTLLVADAGNHLLRTIDLSSASFTVTTVAGDGTGAEKDDVGLAAEFSFPHGLAYDRARKLLYVADFNGNVIRVVDWTNPAAPSVMRLAGTGYQGGAEGPFSSATFNAPVGLALDASGTVLYVADHGGQRVRRLDLAQRQVSTLAGDGRQLLAPGPLPAALHGPWGVALTPRGIVATSWDENSVVLIDRF